MRHLLTLVVLVLLLRLSLAGTPPAVGPALGPILVAAVLTAAVAPLVVRGAIHTRLLAGFVPERELEEPL